MQILQEIITKKSSSGTLNNPFLFSA